MDCDPAAVPGWTSWWTMDLDELGAYTGAGIATLEVEAPLSKAAVRGIRAMYRGPRVRPLERGDIPQLCDIFAQTFRPGRLVKREEIETCLAETYLSAPGDREQPASLVDIEKGDHVRGFMGMVTLHAELGGRHLRGGVLGNFMARDDDRARSALRLVRATVAQELDFIFTDTANRTSLDISRALKFNLLPLQSLAWVKVLRPFGTASFMLSRSIPVGRVLAPFARVADRPGRRLAFANVPSRGADELMDSAVAPLTFAARAPMLLERFTLRPRWDDAELAWLLQQAAKKTRNGPLHFREVADRSGKLIGLYLLYARTGGVGHTLQILAVPGREHLVVGALIRYADSLALVAVRGAANPLVVEGLSRQSGIVYHHVAASIIFTKEPALREAFRSDSACLGGLLGESWTRLCADEFA